MERELDLADIQGNIVRPYGRFGYPITRHMFFHIGNTDDGRRFVDGVRQIVTSSRRWSKVDGDDDPDTQARPDVCVNIGFTFYGLVALGLPTKTLSRLPEEFIDGMAKRWSILGDIGPSRPETWDPIWHAGGMDPAAVHVWVSLNAQADDKGAPAASLELQTERLQQLAREAGKVRLLPGHAGPNDTYQDSAALLKQAPDGTMQPTACEHFGFTDGIGDPTFAGQYEHSQQANRVIGSGKLRADKKGWASLAAGEFIIGHPSEAQELPPSAQPWAFMRNGTFMVYRKLHQNVGSFDRYIDAQARIFAGPGAADITAARETLMAKMVGRWRNGIPLTAAANWDAAQALAAAWADIPAIQAKGPARTPEEQARLTAYGLLLTDFRYAGDEEGAKCPISAHIRRANPRDALDPSFGIKRAGTPVLGVTDSGAPDLGAPDLGAPDSALTNRRRIMRRGAPYGLSAERCDHQEHGVIFMAICASLFRQFEFIQQQWMQYGASFNVGNDTDPLVGLRREGVNEKFVIPADGTATGLPFLCANLPQFIETRGGAYFFIPSLTALREIAEGSVDPT